ncbi:hypothetical protein [Streptomyces stelliscabiei]|uniref:hypothetical protein n=1 Tax=Streptomyces stelliscabiei TaxID=146820 RepID=UPI0029A25819|nr:hypothetical protein [Streptomyces stelliscabiei]MDX2610980.1 hypothetical protein [Streptomyces stelliscabiei]
MRYIAAVSAGWLVLRRLRNVDGAPAPPVDADDAPSRRLMLDISLQERSHQTTAVTGLNAFAAALLGFDAVLGVVGLGIESCPNWKGAALASLATSMLFVLLSLADFVVPSKKLRREPPGLFRKFFPRRPWSISPESLIKHFDKPLTKSEKIAFTTAAQVYLNTTQYVIKPKKRCLTSAVLFLVSALVLGGIGVGVKAVR